MSYSRGLYGVRKVWWQLRREGILAACCTVERLMRQAGLEGVRRGRKRRTTIPDGQARRPTDLVERDFIAAVPNLLWVAGFTYVMSFSGVVCVVFVIDAYSRRIVGWKADTTMNTSLVLDTLEMALWTRQRDGVAVGQGPHSSSRQRVAVHVVCLHQPPHRSRRRRVGRIGWRWL